MRPSSCTLWKYNSKRKLAHIDRTCLQASSFSPTSISTSASANASASASASAITYKNIHPSSSSSLLRHHLDVSISSSTTANFSTKTKITPGINTASTSNSSRSSNSSSSNHETTAPAITSAFDQNDDDNDEGNYISSNDLDGGDNYVGDESVVVELKSNTSKDLYSLLQDFNASTSTNNNKSNKSNNQSDMKKNKRKQSIFKNNNTNSNNNLRNTSQHRLNQNGTKRQSKHLPLYQGFKPLFEEIDKISNKPKRTNMENFKYSDVRRERRNRIAKENKASSLSSSAASSIGNLDLHSFLDTVILKNQNKSTTTSSQQQQQNSTSSTSYNSRSNISSTSESEPKKSIFDAFPIPKKKNPNAYDSRIFEQYSNAITKVIQKAMEKNKTRKRGNIYYDEDILKPVTDWLLKDEPLVNHEYPILKDALDRGINITCAQSYANRVEKSDIGQGNDLYWDHNDENDDDYDDLEYGDNGRSVIKRESFKKDVMMDGSQSQLFLQSIHDQKNKFMTETGFTREQYTFAVRIFNLLSVLCVKTGSTSIISIAWQKIKEAGIIPSLDAMNTYLFTTTTMGASTYGLSTSSFSSSKQMLPPLSQNTSLSAVINILGSQPKVGSSSSSIISDKQEQEKKESNQIDYPTELALFHDLLFEPTEKSISLRVRRLVSQGNATEAEKLLDSFPSSDDAKLRTYLPVLKLYCEQGNLHSAMRLFKRMRDEPTVRLEPENYVLLISSLAENGCFRMDAKDIENVRDLGYKHASGPELLDEVLNEMSEDVLEITSASARRLYNAIATGFHGVEGVDLKPINSLGGLVMNNATAKADELIASRVSIGATTGICPRSGAKLQLIKLQRDQRQQLHQGLLELAATSYEEYSGNINSINIAEKNLNAFADWLNTREGKPFTAIVDGANVAYYMQNFEGGRFNFHQLQFMVEALEKMGETPLVIVPYKYIADSFFVNMGARTWRQVVDVDERKIIDKLTKKGQLYRVPPKCLDDYYWMLASVSNQTKSRNGIDLDVPVENDGGRWPGARPMLISNDQMRDHKLGLLEPRLFRRWFGCYIVNYNFTAFVGSESVDREIGFSTADIFSREIQSNSTDAGKTWHIPVSDWNLDDRFCIRIPSMSVD